MVSIEVFRKCSKFSKINASVINAWIMRESCFTRAYTNSTAIVLKSYANLKRTEIVRALKTFSNFSDMVRFLI